MFTVNTNNTKLYKMDTSRNKGRDWTDNERTLGLSHRAATSYIGIFYHRRSVFKNKTRKKCLIALALTFKDITMVRYWLMKLCVFLNI